MPTVTHIIDKNLPVYATGNQTISGFKTFADEIIARSGIEIYFSGDQRIGNIISGNWNNSGIAYTGIQYNIRLSSGVVPSATNSLLNLAVNNTGVFNVNSKGQVLIQQLAVPTVYDNVFEVRRGGTSYFTIRDDGSIGVPSSNIFIGNTTSNSISLFSSFQPNVIVSRNGFFGISNSNDAGNYPVEHTVRLYRGGDFVLDLRNATYPTSGHQFRVFNATGTNSGEFGKIGWSSNVLQIGTEAGGSGSARALDLIVGGSRVLGASAGGAVSFGTNVGQSSTLVGWVGNCFMRPVNASAGVLTLLNNALDGFDRLQFGGTTNAFPAIKRSGTYLQIRLADNSAYSTMDAEHRLQGTAPTTPTGSGTAGDMRYDNDYIYICTATNTWKRTPISGGW